MISEINSNRAIVFGAQKAAEAVFRLEVTVCRIWVIQLDACCVMAWGLDGHSIDDWKVTLIFDISLLC